MKTRNTLFAANPFAANPFAANPFAANPYQTVPRRGSEGGLVLLPGHTVTSFTSHIHPPKELIQTQRKYLLGKKKNITLMLPSQKIFLTIIISKFILINIFHIVPNKFFTKIETFRNLFWQTFFSQFFIISSRINWFRNYYFLRKCFIWKKYCVIFEIS